MNRRYNECSGKVGNEADRYSLKKWIKAKQDFSVLFLSFYEFEMMVEEMPQMSEVKPVKIWNRGSQHFLFSVPPSRFDIWSSEIFLLEISFKTK